jgi:hypothetical protein
MSPADWPRQRADRKAHAPVQIADARTLWPERARRRDPGRLQHMLERLRDHLRERAPHIRRALPRDMALLLAIVALSRFFAIAVVLTDSVHTRIALVIKGVQPHPGELAVFAYSGQLIPLYYPESWWTRARRLLGQDVRLDGPRPGDGFLKFLVGVAGDRIDLVDGHVLLTTRQGRLDLGACKATTRHGVALHPIRPQVIPEGYVYVHAPHVDALDSRYSEMGLVPVSSIVGKGIALW